MMVNEITIRNCNNISATTINLHSNCLNLKFAPNGTGKSTIAKAILLTANKKDLSELHSYGTENEPVNIIRKTTRERFLFLMKIL